MPNPAPCASNLHNAREASLTFTSSSGALLHGLAGYFDTILYKDVVLSKYGGAGKIRSIAKTDNCVGIRPDTASEGMFSWFPIYFPFKVCL